MKKLLLILTLSALSFVARAQTSTVSLSWDPYVAPANIIGFNFYEFIAPSTYNLVANLAVPTATTISVANVQPGTHTYVMTAYNNAGNSAYSNQATTNSPAIPTAPTNLRATVTTP